MHHIEFAYNNIHLIQKALFPSMKDLGIIYFGYNRFYKNFKGFCLYSDVNAVASLKENDKVPFLDPNGVILKSGEYLADEVFHIVNSMSNQPILNEIKQGCEKVKTQYSQYDFQKSLLIIHKGQEYDETFFFITKDEKFKYFYYQNKEKLYFLCRHFQNYLHKNKPSGNLEISIPHVKHHLSPLTPLIHQQEKLLVQTPFEDVLLSKREAKCLQLIYNGYSNIDIANCFQLKVKTIENYVANLKDKTFCESRKELVQLYQTTIAKNIN